MDGTSSSMWTMCDADDLKNHAMKVFRNATKGCEDNKLKEGFAMIKNYDLLSFYASQMYESLVNNGIREEVDELYMSELGIFSEVAVLTIVIQHYTISGNTKTALKVYQNMIASGVTPTSCTYTILIKALATDSSDASFVGHAKELFLEMLDKGMLPHLVSYESVFDAICCRECVEKAAEFLEEVKAKRFSPNPNNFHFEEAHLAGAMKAMKMYDDLVNNTTDKDMQEVFRKWRNGPGHLTKESRKMIRALTEDENYVEARELTFLCADQGIYSMVLIHTCIIEAYLKFGKTKGALEAYHNMLAAEVSPISYTYSALIKGLTADPNFFGDAKKCLLEMMDKGMQPNAATYSAVLEGFVSQEDKAAEEEGKEFVEVMMGKGFEPNAKAMVEVLKDKPTRFIRKVMNIALSNLMR